MKIAVSATGKSLDVRTDPRFGRCQYFVIVDTETMNFEALPNTAAGSTGGAGIQAAQMVAKEGVQVVLTGSVGPNAFQALSAAGINILTGVFGTIREVVEKFKSGQLRETIVPMGFGIGGGYGMGMGRRGGGMGRGVGRGYWQATGPPMSPAMRPMPPQMSREQEVEMLENQMKNIHEQLDQIRKRLGELKK